MSSSKIREKERPLKLPSSGIIVINKPKDLTSRDVVNIVSKHLNTKKVGHNGTLDPLATGVLVICFGKYTKLNDLLTSHEKEYLAEVTLGLETDTLDITGKILNQNIPHITKEELVKTLKNFEKTYNQEVPKYSAVKVGGKKLYEYAREGKEVTLPKKEVTIYQNELLSFEENKFTFKTKVSKGTYIRSLIRDILSSLNETGTMSNLTRTKQGIFKLEDSYTLDDIKQGNFKVLKVKDILNIPKIIAEDNLKKQIINGAKIKGLYPNEVLFLDKEGNELAIYEKDNEYLKLKIMLYENS